MKIFTVYINPDAKLPLETAQFVEDGFSFVAFIFNLFWFLYHRMWLAAGGVFLFNIIASLLQTRLGVNEDTITIINVAFLTIIGAEATDWYQAVLKKRGYILLDFVSGKNLEQAQQRFFDYYSTQAELLKK